MPRKRSVDRHVGSAPASDVVTPADSTALLDALIALHHPARRRLYEILAVGDPSSVGRLAAAARLAPGSVSHHLKALHRAGFIEPAPELARDTRESWWRAIPRRLSWSAEAFTAGTVGRAVADTAEQANLEHQTRATVTWMRNRVGLPEPWRHAGFAADNLVPATPEQFEELVNAMGDLVTRWGAVCREDARTRPSVERMPVRLVARAFPSDPAAS
jgi:DNA-binding transcriptional ArsR family regulator